MAIREAMWQLADAGYAQRYLVREVRTGEIVGTEWMIRESPTIPWRDGK